PGGGGRHRGGTGRDAPGACGGGRRIPPVKLYAGGEPVEAVFELIDRNVRVPRQVLGDVRSQVAACLTGERGYLGLIGRYGRELMATCPAAPLAQAERIGPPPLPATPDRGDPV